MTTLQDKGWTLAPAGDDDFEKLMTWFPDAASVDLWGGPNFRYPFTSQSFREDCQVEVMESYCLFDASGQLAAFGQSYERTGRGHLARLISNPKMRRQGAGKQLICMIIEALERAHDYAEYSLFVYRHNVPAYECYRSLGFEVGAYPPDAKMPDKCYFLIKNAPS